MAAAAILKNPKHHIYAVVTAISTKCGTVKQFDLPDVSDC